MKSNILLEAIDKIDNSQDLLPLLEQIHFKLNDDTEEGESILHILAQSKHADRSNFSDYLEVLLSAGVNVNALDKQGKGFLSHLKNSYWAHEVYLHLLDIDSFDVNQSIDEESFFEVLSDCYHAEDCLKKLMHHKNFNPNQKTSKQASILLHLIAENLYSSRDFMMALIKHPLTNLNCQNNKGQSVLELLLSNYTGSETRAVILALIQQENLDINTIDQNGHNYLELALLGADDAFIELAKALIQRNINIDHLDNQHNSIFDLIVENKGLRFEWDNKELFLELIKLYPKALLQPLKNGKTVLLELLKSPDDLSSAELGSLLECCKKELGEADFQAALRDCFNIYVKGSIPAETIQRLFTVLSEKGLAFDYEYALALIALKPQSIDQDKLAIDLKRLNPKPQWSVVIRKLEDLTATEEAKRCKNSQDSKKSAAYLLALEYLFRLSLFLDGFDKEVLLLEERYHRRKMNIQKDSVMFAHLFSLDGAIMLNDERIELTGSSYKITAPFFAHLMNAYLEYCENNKLHAEHLEAIKQVRTMTIKAMRYYLLAQSDKNYLASQYFKNTDFYEEMLKDYQSTGFELLTGWLEHAIDLIFKQGDLYRNNGGGCSTDTTTEHYKIANLAQVSIALVLRLYLNNSQESNKSFIQKDLHQLLGLLFTESIPGKFQTVGNCSFQSLLIALKVKYRLFLPGNIADRLYEESVKFFENFYAKEYLSRYANSPLLPQLLMKWILQKLLPEDRLALVSKLLAAHFTVEASQGVLQMECMLEQWRLKRAGKSTEHFDKQIQDLGIVLNPLLNASIQALNKALENKLSVEDLEGLQESELNFQGYNLLHFAVFHDNLNLAAALVKKFPKLLNQLSCYDEEPLCLVQSVEMINLLVKAGADLSRNERHNILDCAIKAKRVDLVKALLIHRASLSDDSAYEAAKQDPKMLEVLMLCQPYSVCPRTHHYGTILHAAAEAHQNDNLKAGIYYGGISPDEKDVNGLTPLDLALKNNHLDTARLLLDYPGTLFSAPYRGDSVINMTQDKDLQQLIKQKEEDNNAYLNYFKAFQTTNPSRIEEDLDNLIVAIRANDLKAVRGCLLVFPKLNVTNNSKLYCTSPLAEAIVQAAYQKKKGESPNLDLVKLLLKTPGIDINARMPSSEPLLFMASALGELAILELFLADPRLDPNQQDNLGYTALHDAVERGHFACVKRLLEDARVDSQILNQQKKSAAEVDGFKPPVRLCKAEVLKHQLKKTIPSVPASAFSVMM